MDKRLKEIMGKNAVIHCATKEQAQEFIKLARDNGIKWCGEVDIDKTFWDEYKDTTCYHITEFSSLQYSPVTYYKRVCEYEIVEFIDFMKYTPKSLLKVGQVVEYRNGKRRLVLEYKDNELFFVGKASYSLVNFDYREDLTHSLSEEMDIVKIFNIIEPASLNILMSCDYKLELIWEREEVREMTVKEISEALGYKVKVVE